jgi:hypothetical protein
VVTALFDDREHPIDVVEPVPSQHDANGAELDPFGRTLDVHQLIVIDRRPELPVDSWIRSIELPADAGGSPLPSYPRGPAAADLVPGRYESRARRARNIGRT